MSGTEAILVHTKLRARHSLCGDLGMLLFFFVTHMIKINKDIM